MDPELTLQSLCRRHRVPVEAARPLLVLLRRAARASPEVRKNLLAVVETTLARESAERAEREQADQRMLIALATALHSWPAGKPS